MEQENASLRGSRAKESPLFCSFPLKMGDDAFVKETRWERKSLIRRKEGVNPELRWMVNLDLRLSCSRSGDGRERWRYSESVSFLWVSCQFHLQYHLWHFQQQRALPSSQVTSRHSRHKPLGSGHLVASLCPSQPVLSLTISQLQTLILSGGFSCCSLWPLPVSPQLHWILLGVMLVVKYRNVLEQWFSLFLIFTIAKPFRKLELQTYHFIVIK